jgi:hypothetical protein
MPNRAGNYSHSDRSRRNHVDRSRQAEAATVQIIFAEVEIPQLGADRVPKVPFFVPFCAILHTLSD